MDYNGRNEQWRKGLALEPQVQSTRSDIIGTSFIPTYKVIWPFLFYISLLLTVWGGFCFMVRVCLRVFTAS